MPEQKLVVAEKPAVGMALAKVLGCHGKRPGYMIGSGYIVTWCVGHLAGLADASAYDPSYAKWRWADLPIICWTLGWRRKTAWNWPAVCGN